MVNLRRQVDVAEPTLFDKTCSRCGAVKNALTDFYPMPGCRDGFNGTCKACMNASSCKRFQERKHEPSYRARRTAASNRFKERVKADPEKSAAVSAQAARWRDKNRPRMAAANRAYRMANADKVREKNQRRRARLLDAYVAPVAPAAIWERDDGVCQICHEPVDPAVPWPDRWCGTIDHIIPLSRQGTHEPGNVQLAHHTCNARKNDRLLT